MWARALWRQQSLGGRVGSRRLLAHAAGERQVGATHVRKLGLVQFSQTICVPRATFEHALALHRAAGDRRRVLCANSLGNIAPNRRQRAWRHRAGVDLAREIGDQYAGPGCPTLADRTRR
jgi:hypothetical protein